MYWDTVFLVQLKNSPSQFSALSSWSCMNCDFIFVQAMDLAKDQKMNFGDEIASGIRLAKKQVWI